MSTVEQKADKFVNDPRFFMISRPLAGIMLVGQALGSGAMFIAPPFVTIATCISAVGGAFVGLSAGAGYLASAGTLATVAGGAGGLVLGAAAGAAAGALAVVAPLAAVVAAGAVVIGGGLGLVAGAAESVYRGGKALLNTLTAQKEKDITAQAPALPAMALPAMALVDIDHNQSMASKLGLRGTLTKGWDRTAEPAPQAEKPAPTPLNVQKYKPR